MGFSFLVRGTAQKKLLTTSGYLSDLRPLLSETNRQFGVVVRRNIDNQGTSSKRWKKLEKSTLAARRERSGYYSGSGRGEDALHWSGGIRNSFTPGKKGNVFRVSRRGREFEAVMGSSNPLAALHHEGRRSRRGAISGRKLKFTSRTGEEVVVEHVGPALIRIPARPLFDESQAQELLMTTKERANTDIQKIWRGRA